MPDFESGAFDHSAISPGWSGCLGAEAAEEAILHASAAGLRGGGEIGCVAAMRVSVPSSGSLGGLHGTAACCPQAARSSVRPPM